jgi:hypothetical protein
VNIVSVRTHAARAWCKPLRAAIAGGVVLLQSGIVQGESVTVRATEGVVHGFLVLRSLEGIELADGDLSQVARGDRVTSRVTLNFRDGSLHEETAVFSQRPTFRLVSNHLVQKGPAFTRAMDVTVDTARSRVNVRYTDDNGKEKFITERLELPPDLANGIITTLLKNLPRDARSLTVPLVAATPKPRIVKLEVTLEGEDSFSIGRSQRKAAHYRIKVNLGGVVGLVAPLLDKQPPDSHVWIMRGEAPAFVKSEGPLSAGGPIWRIELLSPVWP